MVIGWALVALVTVLSLIPHPPHSHVTFGDKFGHVLAYFTLMAWFGQLFSGHYRLALAFLAMGCGLEVVQGMTGYRDASLLDMLANGLGVALGWLTSRRFPELRARLA